MRVEGRRDTKNKRQNYGRQNKTAASWLNIHFCCVQLKLKKKDLSDIGQEEVLTLSQQKDQKMNETIAKQLHQKLNSQNVLSLLNDKKNPTTLSVPPKIFQQDTLSSPTVTSLKHRTESAA